MKKVTNLLMSIGKCRDIIKRKDKKEITKEYIENHLNPDIKKGIKEIIEIKIKKLSNRKEQQCSEKHTH